jgi:hypothetical protein
MSSDDNVTTENAPPATEDRKVPVIGGVWRWFKEGNTPLVVMFAAALAGVYLLSLRQGPSTALAQEKAEDGQVELALAAWQARTEATKKAGGSARDLVNTFYYETKQRQIPLGRLAGNPFEFKPLAATPLLPVAETRELQAVPDEAAAHGDALSAVKELRLQSVLAGPHGATAMISNNILTEGQVIRGWTIVKIEPESVTLKWNDQTVELKMH